MTKRNETGDFAMDMTRQSDVASERPWPSSATPKHPKPAPEWCTCEAVDPGKTSGGLIIPGQQTASGEMDMKRLVLLEASEAHYTGGARVECAIPVGSTLIPRGNCEVQKVHPAWMAPGDKRDLRFVHMRDIAGFMPPSAN